MRHSQADIVMVQETKLKGGDDILSAEQAARNSKWKARIQPCKITDKGGRSAGTAVAVKGYMGMAETPCGDHELNDSPRACFTWVGAIKR